MGKDLRRELVRDVEAAREAMQRRFARYDKSGEEHFNMLSAYHKSLRGSDPQGALYWMARMLDGGEDPMTIFRRAIAMAAEDIGLADPEALKLAVAARDAYHMLGAPEGYLPLSEMTIYLATAPKSNSAKRALDAALDAARRTRRRALEPQIQVLLADVAESEGDREARASALATAQRQFEEMGAEPHAARIAELVS
jgi:putative ATPase